MKNNTRKPDQIHKDLTKAISKRVNLEKMRVINYMLDDDFRDTYKTKKDLVKFFITK